jgi:predicted membrane GTPase involved in stress response
VNHTFELMDKLGASEHQLDFPIVYASALQGWASLDPKVKGENMKPLFDAILEHVPEPAHDPEGRCSSRSARSTIRASSAHRHRPHPRGRSSARRTS